ncbi:MAG TPA: response regulator [Phycisphaerae bacterium]|nr:response regulator [Phycisphaerae bacterium]HRW52311.1 response regulator [Phycisphaerae bacterium]
MSGHLTEVLVVEDEPFALRLAVDALTEAGFDVRPAKSAEEALVVLANSPQLRLVVCDWILPGMSGLEFVQHLRSDVDRRSTFVLVCTGNNEASDVAQAYAAGADDYVSKPWRQSELIARVQSGQRRIALDTTEALIFSLATLAESRDPETGAHLERVQQYCRVLASALASSSPYADQMDGPLVHLIEQTSVLHDIGKVGIPDAILRKPARLTEAEFNVMKTHTSIGAHALNTALRMSEGAPFLNVAHEIALYHHERWDGNGYPFGLAREDIPLSARILAVADVYDALRSRRVYKKGQGHDEAAAIIADAAGEQFDPVVVDAFISNERRFDALRESISDAFPPPRGADSHPASGIEQDCVAEAAG